MDVAGATAGDRLELLELDAELGREGLGGAVELLRGERGEAALVVGDPHPSALGGVSPGVTSGASRRAPPRSLCSMRARAPSPCTFPAAPFTPRVVTTSWSARASCTFSATCG